MYSLRAAQLQQSTKWLSVTHHIVAPHWQVCNQKKKPMQQTYTEGTYIHPDLHLTWKKTTRQIQIPVFSGKKKCNSSLWPSIVHLRKVLLHNRICNLHWFVTLLSICPARRLFYELQNWPSISSTHRLVKKGAWAKKGEGRGVLQDDWGAKDRTTHTLKTQYPIKERVLKLKAEWRRTSDSQARENKRTGRAREKYTYSSLSNFFWSLPRSWWTK